MENIHLKQADLQVDRGITVRMFYGCPVIPELRTQLERSQSWKLAQIERQKGKNIPVIIRHQEKDYFGTYLSGTEATIAGIEAEEKRIHHKINEFCPEFDIESLNFTIFSIVLIKWP